MKKYYKISELIIQKLSGTISDEDLLILESWLEGDEANVEVYRNIANRIDDLSAEKFYKKDIVEEDWNKVCKSLNRKRYKVKRFYILGRIAAVLLLSFGLTYLASNIYNDYNLKNTKLSEEIIKIGQKKAVLVLENGKMVAIDNIAKARIEQSGSVITVNKNQMVYKNNIVGANNISEQKYNTMIVPRAGEYSFRMSDGTKVWLNSDSKLKYPVQFVGNEREVYLEGEAYFEVKRNEKKPFIVKTFSGLDVEVLGTKFNVNAYRESEKITTTLLSGKVKVIKGKESEILKPQEQVVLDRLSKKMDKQKVDAYRFIAWKDGKFIFENARLEDIMTKLSRWYDVEVFYINQEIKDFHFTGDLERYQSISTILNMIQQSTNIKFRIKNSTVIVTSI